MTEYDAVLLLSFGGPDGPEDVMPFLRNVTKGRGVPDERLAEVAEHYLHFGGASPINGQNRALVAAVRDDFDARGIDLPLYWGNRNWAPYVEDVVDGMAAAGVRRALAIPTSAYSSYSGCRQYWEDLARARAAAGPAAPLIDRVRHYFDHPGFVAANADTVRAALAGMPAGTRIVYTAHSIPVAMAAAAGPDGGLYERQLRETARLVTAAVDPTLCWELAWQSRSGPPTVPWLEPDINDRLRELARDGVPGVVVAPIGFVSDHLEVRWDLDTEAAATAAELGLRFARAGTAGTHPAFVSMAAELLLERSATRAPALGAACPATCCPAPTRF